MFFFSYKQKKKKKCWISVDLMYYSIMTVSFYCQTENVTLLVDSYYFDVLYGIYNKDTMRVKYA